MEGTRKRGRPRKRWRDEVEKELNIMGIKKQTGNGQTPQRMEEDCIGSHCLESRKRGKKEQEMKKRKKKRQQTKKSKKKRYTTSVKGWIYYCENLVTTIRRERIKNLRYRVPRNPEDGSSRFAWKAGTFLPYQKQPHGRRWQYLQLPKISNIPLKVV